jgi:hypothetical protein
VKGWRDGEEGGKVVAESKGASDQIDSPHLKSAIYEGAWEGERSEET